jgi:glycosyltransferase involved in cell wall biosynthesis
MRIAYLTYDKATCQKGHFNRDTATIKFLLDLGYYVTPLIFSQLEPTLGQRLRSKILGRIGYRVRTECDRISLVKLANDVARHLEEQPFDIVFSQSTHFTAYLRTTLPVVNWVDAVFDCIVDLYPSHINMDIGSKRAGHRAEQLSLKKSRLTLLTSSWAAKRAIYRYRISEDKIAVVPRAAYLPEAVDVEELAGKFVRQPNKKLQCLLIGNDWHRKGCDIAVQAIRQLRALSYDVRLSTIGMSVPEDYSREAWIDVVAPLRKGVPEEWHRMRRLFFEADVCLLPTRADFTPNVICEAYAFGLPMVASPVGAIPEMIDHGFTGFVTHRIEDPEEYTHFLYRLATEPGMLSQFSVQARNKFEAEYALPVVIRKLAAHLERVYYQNQRLTHKSYQII